MSPQKSLAPARSGRERGPEGGPGAEVFYFDSVMDIEERMTLGLEDLLFPEGKVDSPDLTDDFILTTPTDAKRPNVFNTPTANSDQGEYDDIFEMMKPHESITDSKEDSQVVEAVWSLDTSGSYSPVTDDITPVGEAFTITLPISSSTSDLPTELAPVEDSDSIFSTDPMNVVSVLDVEGKEESASWTSTKKAANISLIIPEKEELSLIDTPSVEKALEMDGNHDDLMFDLLSFVNTDAMPIDDPAFLSCLDDLSPSALNADPLEMAIKRSQLVGLGKFEITPARSGIAPEMRKKDHARKRFVASSTVTSSSLAGDHAYVFDGNSWTGPEDGTKEVKYRRMRDLNNEASKRCRENRKRKVETLEEEEHFLILSNAELREKVMRLEKKVTLVKEYVKNIVRNGRSGK